jgi:molecular chaperone GrpE
MGNETNKSDKKSKAAKGSKAKQSKAEQAETKINELEENLAELNDKYLRLFSEFDNYRKRTNKERLDLMSTASAQVIMDLLPVLDDFERAFVAMESGSDKDKSYIEGTKLIYNKLKSVLGKRGLEPMKSIGETFDTDFHEALTNIPASTPDQKGKVVDEIEKGYMLKGKVIRFAKVVVGQ